MSVSTTRRAHRTRCAMVANVSKLPEVSGAIVCEASVAANPHCIVSIVGFD